MRYRGEQALGLVETVGMVPAIYGADSMLKAADVQLTAYENVGSTLVTIMVTGDVAAVTASVKAGAEAASSVGKLTASNVMPRPVPGVADIAAIYAVETDAPPLTKALGLIETFGIVFVLEAADAMIKAANVELIGYENVASGYISVLVEGDVAACKAAVDAGIQAVEAMNASVYSSAVIPTPHPALATMTRRYGLDPPAALKGQSREQLEGRRVIVDNDLLSMQQARILAENAFAGQQRLALFSQEKLDTIVEAMAAAILPHCRELAVQAQEETTYGKWQDKWVKNRFVCQEVVRQLRGLRCIGKVSEDTQNGLTEIGVPMGVVVALCPVTSPVSTTIFKSLAAVKSGNAILFSPHPKASKSIGAALDILYDAALKAGLPEGCIGYLRTVTKSGTVELMQHQYTSMLLVTGAGSMYTAAVAAGKPLIYGGAGSGPAFVERTADIRRAARDIILSKSFDNGIAPSAEQSIVVDACISGQVKEALQQESGYFLNPEQSDTLASLLFCPNSRRKRDTVGLTAEELAERAGFTVPAGTKVLIAERSYVLESTPYSRELHAPVLAYYVEDDWMHACEKCIELLLYERKAHTLVIHSNAPAVIEQFALRKPVGRLLVNTPSVFGGMGMTTNLFPSPVLGGASSGHGIIAGNVSPKNLVYMRTVGYRMRDFQPEFSEPTASGQTAAAHTEKTVSQPESSQPGALQVLEHLLNETIEAMQRPSAS